MGIGRKVRKLRAYGALGRAANEAAAASGAPPHLQRGMLAGFVNVMAEALAPRIAATAERRGGPLPGSDPDIAAGSAWPASLAAGVAAISARDAAFDPALLASFGEQVFSAVVAVWAGADSGTVRPVMSDDLWEPLAAATAVRGSKGRSPENHPFARLEQQQVEAEIAGLHAGSWYDSAMIVMHVHLAGPLPPDFPPMMTSWDEDWLFQRSVRPGGDPMIRPPQCPACGAAAQAAGASNCQHCQAPMPFLTAGWLVSGIVSRHPSHAMAREHFARAVAENPAAFENISPAMRQFLPVDPDEVLAGELNPRPGIGGGQDRQQ